MQKAIGRQFRQAPAPAAMPAYRCRNAQHSGAAHDLASVEFAWFLTIHIGGLVMMLD